MPAMQETWVQSLGWEEDPLEKGMATRSSILAWITPWTEEPGGLQSRGLQRVRHDQVTNTSTKLTRPWQLPALATIKEIPGFQCYQLNDRLLLLELKNPYKMGKYFVR